VNGGKLAQGGLLFARNPDKLSSCNWERPDCDVNSIEEKNK
tara:strand:- start:67 stop:189 length:123 start_codon:yes stop_codon:yes gene_type:complete